MKITLHRAKPEDNRYRPADPGDFGAGPYWTTSRARAAAYGSAITTETFEFRNPITLAVKDAYDLADKFGTVKGLPADRRNGARAMTEAFLRSGHDAVVVIHSFRNQLEFEVVIIREYRR